MDKLTEEFYVVELSNGNYFSILGGRSETSEIKFARHYVFDWQIAKDWYLLTYIDSNELTYKTIKVKGTTNYEIV